METIGRLAHRYGLARSTLLYYDALGLLRPSERTPSNYRRYDAADVARLEQVIRYRAAGVPLADVQRILDAPGGAPAAILERRLEALNAEIAALRGQQEGFRADLGLLRAEFPDVPLTSFASWVNAQDWGSLPPPPCCSTADAL